jgi:hypothetical protein
MTSLRIARPTLPCSVSNTGKWCRARIGTPRRCRRYRSTARSDGFGGSVPIRGHRDRPCI